MSTKKIYLSILTLLVVIVMTMTVLVNPVTFVVKATNPYWVDVPDWGFKTVEIANGNFASHGGNLPAAPSSWQEVNLSPSSPSSEIMKNGVIELTNVSYTANRQNYGLDQYFDENTYPQTPLENKNVLLINTNGLNTAYGYATENIEVASNSFYKLQTYVKTSNFADGTGASITLSGLKDKLSFVNINTTTKSATTQSALDNFGWQRYEFFVQTGDATSISLTLGVGFGNSSNEGSASGTLASNPANGFAMFGDSTLQKLSPLYFDNQIHSSMADIEKPFVQVKQKSIEILGNLSKNFVYNPAFRNQITQNPQGSLAHKKDAFVAPLMYGDIINTSDWQLSGSRIVSLNATVGNSSNNLGVTQNFRSPNFATDPNVLLMTTFDPTPQTGGTFTNRAISAKLKDNLKILRHEHYRMDVWYRTESVVGGPGAFVLIDGQSNIHSNNFELKHYIKNLESSKSEDGDKYSWTLKSVYFRGSALNDRDVSVTLGLGDQDEGLASGLVAWTNPVMYSITAEEYDAQVGDNNGIVFDVPNDNKIGNGNFNVGQQKDLDKFEYPLSPTNWQYITPSTSGTKNWSNNAVADDRTLNGIVPTTPLNSSTIKNPWIELNQRGIVRPTNHPNGRLPDNLMLLSSLQNTAFGYRSSPFSFDASTVSAVQVTMLANTEGYGANLVLKQGNEILSTIEQIDTNGTFETFTFFIQNNDSEIQDLTVEIWLGLGDSVSNLNKLSRGYAFVDNVQIVPFETALGTAKHNLNGITDFDSLLNRYTTTLHDALNTRVFPNYNVYTNKLSTFLTFDRYSNNNIRSVLDWRFGSLGGNATVNDSNTTWGTFDIGVALGNSDTGGLGIVPTNWVGNPDNSPHAPNFVRQNGRPNFVHQTRDEENRLTDSSNPFVLMFRHSQPTASRLSSNVKFKPAEKSYYKASIRLTADLTALTKDSKGLGIELSGTGFKFNNIRDTRDIANDKNPSYQGWWANGYKEFVFYVKTTTQTPELSIDVTLGGTDHSKEFVAGAVYINDISFVEMSATDFEREISKDIDYEEFFEHRLENRIYADIEKGVPGPPPETVDPGVGSINWAFAPSIIFAIFVVLVLFIIFINGFSKKAEPKPIVAKPKKSTYDRDQAVVKSVGIPVDIKDSYDLFDDDVLVNKIESMSLNPAVEYEEIEIEEEVLVELPQEEFDEPQQPEEIEQLNEDDQIAIIEQIDEEVDLYVPPKNTTKTVKQTIKRTILVPKKIRKEKNLFQDSFDD